MNVPAGQAEARNSCLSCHASHYPDKGNCTRCHRGNPRTIRKNIAHTNLIAGKYSFFTFSSSRQVRNGRQALENFGCRRCHTVSGNGNKAASNLDMLLHSSSPQITDHAIQFPAQQMPDFRFTRDQRTELVNAIENAGLERAGSRQEIPQIIHFSGRSKKKENAFEKHCGACHKLLSYRQGGLGQGEAGPNLSGLLSRFYPGAIRNHERWSSENLARWLQNPRDIRPHATMRPMMLKKSEFEEIAAIILEP